MRLLFLTPDAFGGHGGIAQYCRDLLTAFCSHPDLTEVVAIPRVAPKPIGQLPERLRYVTTGLDSKLRFARATVEQLWGMPTCDAVVCAHINLLPFAILASARFRAPLSLIVYGIDAWNPTRGRISNGLCTRVDHVISISSTTLERFRRWAPLPHARTHVLPNAFNPDALSPGPKPEHLQHRYKLRDRKVLMTLGRMPGRDRHKGFDEVLEVMPRIVHHMPEALYLLAGAGPDQKRLQAKARSLGLQSHVVFTGEVAEREKAEHFRLADVFVMPSRGEGFGFVLLEAMACGIPTIGSKVDGGREALRDGLLGALVDPENQGELESAILAALRDGSRHVPAGLEFFRFENFRARALQSLTKIAVRRGATEGRAA